jgi:FlaA1/EpsC-like NDP-sugar epimerase
MTRFFMTIPEAVSLVVQAGGIGGRGQVFVLDMGEPVRIVELARNMIRLSGKTEEEIPIAFIGARPGEKLHEELWSDDEAVAPTPTHRKILRTSRPPIDDVWLDERLRELERLVREGDTLGAVAKLGEMVTEPVRERVGANVPEPRPVEAPKLEDTIA